MKSFEAPQMTVVRLARENIICVSNCPSNNICSGFICNDCVDCPGSYTCWEFICNEKYS